MSDDKTPASDPNAPLYAAIGIDSSDLIALLAQIIAKHFPREVADFIEAKRLRNLEAKGYTS